MYVQLTPGKKIGMMATVCMGLTTPVLPAQAAAPRSVATAAKQPIDPVALLKKSQWAVAHVPFEGKEMTVTWTDRHSESAIARRSHSGRRERTEYLAPGNIAGRVYLSDAKMQRIYNPKTRRVIVRPRIQKEEMNLPLLSLNYRILLDSTVRTVADRPSLILRLQPKTLGKPRSVLWLDRKTCLPLKHERFHADGSPAGLTQFTEIRIGGPLPASRFALNLPKGVKVIREDAAPSGSRHAHFKPSLPGGYRLQECKRAPGNAGWHCVYTDGLDLLSVFSLEDGKNRKPRGTPVRVGAYPGVLRRQSHQWMVLWTANDKQWTLIGDLSRDLVLRIARFVAIP